MNHNAPWNKGKVTAQETRDKISAALKGKVKGVANDPEVEKLRKLKISRKMKEVGGGYRPGSGLGKKGWYRGYFCDSTWELAFIIFNLDNNVPIKRNIDRFEYEHNGEKHKYVPDFKIENQYIEVKGFVRSNDRAKFKVVKDLLIIGENEIKPYLNYAKNKYGKDLKALYERKVA